MLFSITGRFDALELGAVEEFATACETRFSVGFDFATILSAPVPHHFVAAGRAENADTEQIEKMIPFIKCEIALCQYVCELDFGVNIFDLDFGVLVDSVQ